MKEFILRLFILLAGVKMYDAIKRYKSSDEEGRLELIKNTPPYWYWVGVIVSGGLTEKIAYAIASNPKLSYMGQSILLYWIKAKERNILNTLWLIYGLVDNPNTYKAVFAGVCASPALPTVYSRATKSEFIVKETCLYDNVLRELVLKHLNTIRCSGDATLGLTNIYSVLNDCVAHKMKHQDLINLNIIMSELMSNAIIHGVLDIESREIVENVSLTERFEYILQRAKDHNFNNHYLIVKHAIVKSGIGNTRMLEVNITDSGKGWDTRRTITPLAHTGRGLTLIEKLGGLVEYNAAGNSVRLSYKF